ncbi:hypothetical protein QX249_12185 [Vibrio parahaemolyticus]|uniref:Uncharacterized protein n=1 Tax=Vibrio parahaemolyticus TaxID=670 RepID=A0AAW8Q0R9_VIBPH|nr:hypothetical protein [Vibrio parahaemolyticus]EGR2227374.1 hypothetical protein [Vibrio parahaemolyticus]MDS1821421.1 hypothetical protein [Vibrio parahaemolyticus]
MSKDGATFGLKFLVQTKGRLTGKESKQEISSMLYAHEFSGFHKFSFVQYDRLNRPEHVVTHSAVNQEPLTQLGEGQKWVAMADNVLTSLLNETSDSATELILLSEKVDSELSEDFIYSGTKTHLDLGFPYSFVEFKNGVPDKQVLISTPSASEELFCELPKGQRWIQTRKKITKNDD